MKWVIITSSWIEQCRSTAARSKFLTEPNKEVLIKNNFSASVHHKDICLDYSFVRDIKTEQVVLNCLDCFLLLSNFLNILLSAHIRIPHWCASWLYLSIHFEICNYWSIFLSTCREGGAGQQLCSWLAQSAQSFKLPAGRSFIYRIWYIGHHHRIYTIVSI